MVDWFKRFGDEAGGLRSTVVGVMAGGDCGWFVKKTH